MGEQKEGSEEVKQEEPKKSFSLGNLKPFAIGAAILIFIGVLYVLYTTLPSGNLPPTPNTTITGDLAVLNPSDLKVLSSWDLNKERSFADVSLEDKKVLLQSGVTDLATWEFTRGTENLIFQAIEYDSNDSLQAAEPDVTRPFGTMQYLTDVGSVKGVIGKYPVKGRAPLALYFTQDNTMFLITYFNQGNVYNNTTYDSDQQFLRYIGERTITKLEQVSEPAKI